VARQLLLCLLVLLTFAGGASALEVVLQDGLDGYEGTDDCLLYAPSVVADVNWGVASSIACGMNRWGELQVALVRFDLAALPHAQVVQARLELYADAAPYPYRDVVIGAAPVAVGNARWRQGTNDGERVPVAGTACWNWLAYDAQPWAGSAGLGTAGVDYLEAPMSRATVPAGSEGWVVFALSPDLVQGWLDDPDANTGLRLYPVGEALEKGDVAGFASSEAEGDPSQRPRLVLELVERPGLAEDLERVKRAKHLAELTGQVDEYGRVVEEVGRPPRAAARLRQLRARLRAAEGQLSAERLSAAAELLAQARTRLSSDRGAARNEAKGLPTDFALGVATSMQQVFRRDVPFTGDFRETLHLAAAGNEHEGGQVVVVPIDADLRRVRWRVEPFTDSAAGVRITAAPVGYVRSASPALATATSPSEWWPDPLLDFLEHFDCPVGEVQPIWLSVYVPPGTRPGRYSTRLTVSAREARSKSLEVRLRVFGFDVPKEQHLKTVWGTGEDMFAHFYPDYDETLAWKYFDLMLDHRMAPNDLYRTRPTGRPGEDGVYHLASVDALRKLRETGSAWWNIGYVLAPEHVSIGPGRTYGSYEDYLAECVRMFEPELERVRAAGWPEGSYGVYFLDETTDFEALAKAMETLRTHFPGVPLMTTGYDRSYGVGADSPVAQALDIWVPLTPSYQEDWERICEGRTLGKQAWWYICVAPRGRSDLNWFVQYPVIRARLLMGAATWKYQPDGFLYYRVTGWTYNERKVTSGPLTAWTPRYHPSLPDGDGLLLCAGPEGPLTTIRLENLRDGLEDFEYWWLLRDLVSRVEADGASVPERALLGVPEPLLTDLRTYSEDPTVLYQTRAALADAIEGLSRRLGGSS
jgi:hypothetical protein